MENVSTWIIILFLLTTCLTVWLFLKASAYSYKALTIFILWAAIQMILGWKGFYLEWYALPPRFPLLILPAILFIIGMFVFKKGQSFIDSTDIKILTILHTIRILVEISLYEIFISGLIPESMTFSGSNFDILSGLSAPLVYYLVFIKKIAGRTFLLVWNFLCLGLLLNIVTTAILSAPTPFQQLAFDQPNTAIFYFPFVLLPALIVPIVLFAHLAAIRKLIKMGRSQVDFI